MATKVNKILPRVVMILTIFILISALLLSAIFAKYTKDDKESASLRPAAFEFLVHGQNIKEIKENMAADGAPDTPIGYRNSKQHYIFSIESCNSEVGITVETTITFASKVYNRILKARENPYQDGLWCDYKIYEAVVTKNSDGEDEITGWTDITLDTENGNASRETVNANGSMTWSRTLDVDPHKNPDGRDSGKAYYKLELEFFNSTLMNEWNYEEYFLATNGIDINVTGTQRRPA